jgi:hypothetical protein
MACTGTRRWRNKRMPAKNDDLHGNVPDRAEVALPLIDVINDLEFQGSEPSTLGTCGNCRGTPPSTRNHASKALLAD